VTEEHKPATKKEEIKPAPVIDNTARELDCLRLKDKLQEALRHLKHVHSACELLALRLIERDEPGDRELAQILIFNAFTHDLSKLRGIEWQWIHQTEDKEMLLLAISQHQQSNEHHPEFWGGVDFMPPVRVAEMVADWFARSQEKGTDMKDWVKTALKRFDIKPNTKLARHIRQFTDLLLDPPFKPVK